MSPSANDDGFHGDGAPNNPPDATAVTVVGAGPAGLMLAYV